MYRFKLLNPLAYLQKQETVLCLEKRILNTRKLDNYNPIKKYFTCFGTSFLTPRKVFCGQNPLKICRHLTSCPSSFETIHNTMAMATMAMALPWQPCRKRDIIIPRSIIMKANLKLFYVSILTAVGAAVNFIPLLIAGGPRSVPAAEVPLPEFNPPPLFC